VVDLSEDRSNLGSPSALSLDRARKSGEPGTRSPGDPAWATPAAFALRVLVLSPFASWSSCASGEHRGAGGSGDRPGFDHAEEIAVLPRKQEGDRVFLVHSRISESGQSRLDGPSAVARLELGW